MLRDSARISKRENSIKEKFDADESRVSGVSRVRGWFAICYVSHDEQKRHVPDLPLMSLALRLRALRAMSVSVELVGW